MRGGQETRNPEGKVVEHENRYFTEQRTGARQIREMNPGGR
jgi:hypothetical protein